MDDKTSIPSILTLYDERSRKEKSKQDIYNIVLNKCVEKIVYTNRHTDKTYVVFEIPSILIGHPKYDMKSCTLFIIRALSEHRYYVEFIEPSSVYIDWGSVDRHATKKGYFDKRIKSDLHIGQTEKLREQTQELLKKFPKATKVVYVYGKGGKEGGKKKG